MAGVEGLEKIGTGLIQESLPAAHLGCSGCGAPPIGSLSDLPREFQKKVGRPMPLPKIQSGSGTGRSRLTQFHGGRKCPRAIGQSMG